MHNEEYRDKILNLLSWVEVLNTLKFILYIIQHFEIVKVIQKR